MIHFPLRSLLPAPCSLLPEPCSLLPEPCSLNPEPPTPAPPLMDFTRWFHDNRHRLSANGLYLDGGEPGRPDPAEFDTARVRLLICRPSTYAGTIPSITHRLLLWAARQVPGVYVDLAFLPPASDTALLTRDNVPWWLASGCKHAPADFDLLAVSLSVPQEAVNLPALYRHSGLHLGAVQRLADSAQPLVILGGNAAAAMPFLHGDAEGPGSGGLADLVCNGDGIVFLQTLLRRLLAHPDLTEGAKAQRKPFSKPALLEQLAAELPGAYVPHFFHHEYSGDGSLRITPVAPGLPMPVAFRRDDPEVWTDGYDGAYIPFADTDTEETLPFSVGCRFRCRFCQTGWGRGEPTDTPVPGLLAAARRLKANTAASDLNLLASDACSVPGIAAALDGIRPLFRQASLKSLAAASLSRDPAARELIQRLDKHEFSLGVEGFSRRLRAWLGKEADPDVLAGVLRSLAHSGLRQVKLFLIATGRETADDVTELIELFEQLRKAAPAGRFIASVTPLFHAPFTPLQCAAYQTPDLNVMRQARKALTNLGVEFRWSAGPVEIRFMNRLTRAGRRATPALVRFSLEENVRYGDALPETEAIVGERFLAEALGGDDVLAALDAEPAERDALPWDDFDAGTPRRLLWKVYAKTRREWNAGKIVDVTGEDTEEILEPAAPRRAPPKSPPRETRTVILPAQLPESAAAHPDATAARGLIRAWLREHPDRLDAYAGNPRLIRLPRSFGRAILIFDEFAALTLVKPGQEPLVAPTAPDQLVALLRVRDLDETAWRRLEGWLRTQKIAYQTRRDGTVRRHAIAHSSQGKSGLFSLGQDTASGTGWICCSPKAAPFLRELAAAGLPPVESLALCQPAAGRCPDCKEPLVEALPNPAASGQTAPFCPCCPPPVTG